jgi:hypothetical protein
MGTKTTNLVFISLLLGLPVFSNAQVMITEIMYDLKAGSDSGREWIEVYNAGPISIEANILKLFENGVNHKISGTILQPSSYAIIADNPDKFKADWPNYSGTLFDSAFALGNEGDSLELRDASSTLDTVSFTKSHGAAGDGNSLNRESLAHHFWRVVRLPAR